MGVFFFANKSFSVHYSFFIKLKKVRGASTGAGDINIGRLGDEVITRDSLRCAAEWILHRARKNACKSSCQVIVIVADLNQNGSLSTNFIGASQHGIS
jgi:hypothetical protein